MGFLKPCKLILITGRDRGQYIDYRPHSSCGFVRPGVLTDRKFDINGSIGHIFDANAFGNTMNNGHFYARYRIWGCAPGKQDYSLAPRLRWSFVVSILSDSPNREILQWEMKKHLGLLSQSAHYASLREICGLVQCHNQHSARIHSDALSRKIQSRLMALSKEEIQQGALSVRILQSYGFTVPHLESEYSGNSISRKVRSMLEQRKVLLGIPRPG